MGKKTQLNFISINGDKKSNEIAPYVHPRTNNVRIF